MDDERISVWSSEKGRLCPGCGQALSACVCAEKAKGQILGDGKVRVARQTAGRKGKTVTVITGLPLTAAELAALLKDLKKTCGSGGAVKDGTLEIQGDHRDRLVQELVKRGYAAKKSGG